MRRSAPLDTNARFVRAAARFGLMPVLLSFVATSASGQQGYTQEELRALPRVCLAQRTLSNALYEQVVSEAEKESWKRRLGPSYKSFHHFCWGLIDMRRASEDRTKQKFYYNAAVANFEFVVRHTRQTDVRFPMFPEVLLRKGMALQFLGRNGEAAVEFNNAIRAKPDYTPAYAALIDLYIDLEDLAEARSILEKGLRAAPQSKILLNKKAELDTHPKRPITRFDRPGTISSNQLFVGFHRGPETSGFVSSKAIHQPRHRCTRVLLTRLISSRRAQSAQHRGPETRYGSYGAVKLNLQLRHWIRVQMWVE